MDKGTLQTLLPIGIIALVFLFRFRNISRARRFRPERLWILPAIYTALVAVVLFAMPPAPQGWALLVIGLAAGSALGWQRARLMHLHIDPETREFSIRQSPAAFLLLLGIVVLRRLIAPGGDGAGPGHALPASALLITDAAFGFALGMVVMMRYELCRRARALHVTAAAAVFADAERG